MSTAHARGDVPPTSRSRFQFSLRTMLALTALVAWMFGCLGIAAIGGFILLASMTLIEAGCTRSADVVSVLARNLLAFFVCSLVFGTVGFGLMLGQNPTGWFGTDQFLFAPLLTPVEPYPLGGFDPFDSEDVAQLDAQWLRHMFRVHMIACATGIMITHRVLARRVRFGAYLVVWIGMAGLVYPLAGSWMVLGSLFGREYLGWLTRLGFGAEMTLMLPALAVGGVAALAGTLILGSQLCSEGNRLSLFAPHSQHPLICLGYGLAWLLCAVAPPIVIVPPIVSLLAVPTLPPETAINVHMALAPATAGAGGLIAAMIGSRIWLKRFHWPLVLSGGFGSLIALVVGEPLIGAWWAALLGLVAGALVVLASFVLRSLRVDDPGGAVAVHAVCSAWGVLSIGLFPVPFLVGASVPFSTTTFGEVNHLMQWVGVAVSFGWVFFASAAIFWLIRRTTMLPMGDCHTRGEPLP